MESALILEFLIFLVKVTVILCVTMTVIVRKGGRAVKLASKSLKIGYAIV